MIDPDGGGSPRRRPVRAVSFAVTLAAVVMPACVAPARSFDAYEGKAVASADAALSAVRTAALTAGGAEGHKLFAPYVSIALEQAERDASSVASQFSSIQPPDAASDRLRAQLQPILGRASAALAQLRIDARRGDIPAYEGRARQLADVAASLDRFARAHS
jgi:hypothetical protein